MNIWDKKRIDTALQRAEMADSVTLEIEDFRDLLMQAIPKETEEPRAVCWVYPGFFRQLDKSHCGVAYRFQNSDGEPRTPLYASPWPTGWISLKDQWPPSAPFNEHIVFYSPDLRNPTDTWIGIYRDNKFFSCGVEVVNVTHWMPQPIPPIAPENKT